MSTMKPMGEIRSYKWINDTLSSNFIKDEILASTDSFAAFFIHKSSTCSLKSSLLSNFIPKMFSLHVLEFLGEYFCHQEEGEIYLDSL